MTTDTTTKAETKRDRVRRLLIHPLEKDGMRKRHRTPDEMHRAFLDRIADTLSYMSDVKLRLFQKILVSKGEGAEKHFWPSYVTIRGWAEQIDPRPLDHEPEILSWFRSKAGPLALQADCHVEQYQFIQKKKRPPMAQETAYIIDAAKSRRDDHERWSELIERRGVAYMADEKHAIDEYQKIDAIVREIIEGREA